MLTRMTELDRRSEPRVTEALFLQATKVTTLLSLLIASLLILDGGLLLELWVGPSFRLSSYPLLVVLTVGYLIALVQSPSMMLLTARGQHAALGWWTFAEGVVNLALSIYWAPRLGLMGVALGTAVPMILTKTCIQPWYTIRSLHVPAHRYGAVFVRPAAVTAIFGFICSLFPEPAGKPSVYEFLARVTWHVSLFLALSIAIATDREERRWARGLLTRLGAAFASSREPTRGP
jgi:O-antigen/teichoic acid export membrane protein